MFLVATSILEKLEQTERILDQDNICSHLFKYKADFYIDGSWQCLFYSKPSQCGEINNLLVAFSGNIYDVESQDEKILNTAILQRIACAEDNAIIEALNCTYGDFNGLIIDKFSKEIRLLGSRSGLPPLYYYLGKELFLITEELDLLLRIVSACNGSLSLNKKYVGTFLVGICDEEFAVDPTITIYDQVYIVPPAHIVYLSEGTKRIKRYWTYWKSNSLDRSNIEEKLRQLLFQAVSVRISTPFSIGVRLSGGLDSGSIACILGKILQNSFYCYSNVFDFSNSLNEKYYVEQISRHINAAVRYIPADHLWALRDTPNLSRRPQPEPYQGWFYPVWISSKHGSLKQGRTRNCAGNLTCRGIIARARNADF
ncbi:hypothetical protein JVX88_34035 [Leptolyngbya sp. 7M]|nr:hypothetical protein JVX88_34035 [Leptolyngbya sp. 7M]